MLKPTEPSTSPSSGEIFALVTAPGALPAFMPYLEQIASGSSGRYAAEDIAGLISTGDMHLWCMAGAKLKAVIVTEFITWPRRRGLTIFGAVGADPKSWMQHVPVLAEFAKANGADLLCGWMRKGYGKITGWRETHRLYELELGD